MNVPHYEDDAVTIWHGDCLDVLREMPDASVDAIVTDPPYGLGFMGQKWDTYANETGRAKSTKDHKFDHVGGNHNPSNSADATRTRRVESQRFGEWCEGWVAECLRVLKPGGHMLAFGGTRTWHRLAVAVEDAGFEVRDSIAWLYGSGFPKSLDVSKAINAHEKTGGSSRTQARRAALGEGYTPHAKVGSAGTRTSTVTATTTESAQIGDDATPAAQQWQGWGTALKPAFEPIVVARKPLVGTVAANVLAHGTGALNVDGCRVGAPAPSVPRGQIKPGPSNNREMVGRSGEMFHGNPAGRWPANVLLDGDAAAELDEQSGTLTSGSRKAGVHDLMGYMGADAAPMPEVVGDSGGASRFFPVFRYQAKAPTRERVKVGNVAHPTVKPLALMRWLVRLVTPPGGVVLDPFAGSGTTVEAAMLEGFQVIGIEREADYLPLIEARIARNRTTDEGLPGPVSAMALFDLEEPA